MLFSVFVSIVLSHSSVCSPVGLPARARLSNDICRHHDCDCSRASSAQDCGTPVETWRGCGCLQTRVEILGIGEAQVVEHSHHHKERPELDRHNLDLAHGEAVQLDGVDDVDHHHEHCCHEVDQMHDCTVWEVARHGVEAPHRHSRPQQAGLPCLELLDALDDHGGVLLLRWQ